MKSDIIKLDRVEILIGRVARVYTRQRGMELYCDGKWVHIVHPKGTHMRIHPAGVLMEESK